MNTWIEIIVTWVVATAFGLPFGFAAFCGIILPLFFSLPLAKRLEREGKLIRPIPVLLIMGPPILWGGLLALSVWIAESFFAESALLYYCILGFTLIVTTAQIPMRNPDLMADFKDTYKQYLRFPEETPQLNKRTS